MVKQNGLIQFGTKRPQREHWFFWQTYGFVRAASIGVADAEHECEATASFPSLDEERNVCPVTFFPKMYHLIMNLDTQAVTGSRVERLFSTEATVVQKAERIVHLSEGRWFDAQLSLGKILN